MPAPDVIDSGRPSITSVASHESSTTPSCYDDERQKNGDNSIEMFPRMVLQVLKFGIKRTVVKSSRGRRREI